MITSRCWELVSLIKHPETGETLIDTSAIDSILSEHSQVTSYAWIIHDEDTYTLKDEKDHPENKCGTVKAAHLHLVMKFSRPQEVKAIAKWFGIAENFLQKKNNGRGKRDAYYDSLRYLTHEDKAQQKAGKHLYDDSEVTFRHFEEEISFREYLDREAKAFEERKSKYGKADISKKDQLRFEVLYNGMTIRQLRQNYKLEYSDDMEALKKRRGDYLANCLPPPFRINIYIDGQGGAGKSLLSKAIARAIIDPKGEMDDEDIFCCVSGDDSVAFESYDGQPILIWDDFRGKELLDGCAGKRGNAFKVFAVNPDKTIQKKKYSSVNLINTVNIVNSVQPWHEFLDSLAGEYTDRHGDLITSEEKYKVQSYRRFPVIVTVTDTGYDIRTNDGFFGNGSKSSWTTIPEVEANFKEMIQACGTNTELYKMLCVQAVSPIIELYEKAKAIMSHTQDGTDEEIMARYSKVGQTAYDRLNELSGSEYEKQKAILDAIKSGEIEPIYE